MEDKWFILYNGQQVGPMTKEQLLHYGLNPNSQVWREGMPAWVAVYTLPELMSMLPTNTQHPSPTPGGYGGYSQQYEKSKTTAGVLAILLGVWGAHYFYCGKIGAGFITILLTFITFGFWCILSLIQGIMMLSMTDQQFNDKYVNNPSFFPLF